MQYSLVSRFEGCFWGGILGEQLGIAAQSSQAVQAPMNRYPWYLDQKLVGKLTWSRVAMQLVQAMTRSPNPNLTALTIHALSQIPLEQLNPATLAIVTLPGSLYYHDDLNRQRHYLEQVIGSLAVDPSNRDWVPIFGYTLAQAVKGQLQPQHFMSQLLAYYRVAMADGSSRAAIVLEQLQQIETCQVEMASLETILATLGPTQDTSVAIALICFLQSPDHFRLALTRSVQLSHRSPVWSKAPWLSVLIGSLVGSHKSSAGIPATWKIYHLLPDSGNDLIQQIPCLSRVFYASWAGAYTPASISTSVAVAAPWVIRGR